MGRTSNSNLRLARVIAFHPEGPSADLWFLDDGWRLPRAPIMCEMSSSDSGASEFPELADVDEKTLGKANGRYMIAVVGRLRGHGVVLGFLPSSYHEMFFADNRAIKRFGSDVYWTVTKDGDCELYHPSGTYVRLGQDLEHEDLTKKDTAKRFELRRNLDKIPGFKLVVASTTGQSSSVSFDGNGNVDLQAQESITLTARQVTVNASEGFSVTGDTTMTGSLTVTGLVTFMIDLAVGTITSFLAHTHLGVTSGSSSTTPPTPGT